MGAFLSHLRVGSGGVPIAVVLLCLVGPLSAVTAPASAASVTATGSADSTAAPPGDAQWLSQQRVSGGGFEGGGDEQVAAPVNGSDPETGPGHDGGDTGANPIGEVIAEQLPDWLFDLEETVFDILGAGIERAGTRLHADAVDLIDGYSDLMFGMPAPGEPMDPGTWTDPAGAWWDATWTTYWYLAAVATALLVPAWMLAFGGATRRDQRQSLRDGIVSFAVILGGWLVLAITLHAADLTLATIRPSGDEFFTSFENFTRLGVGLLSLLFIGLIEWVVLFLALVSVLLQEFFVYVLVATWPLYWTLRAFPHWTARAVGKLPLGMLAALIFMKLFQVALLRFLFELPLEARWSALPVLLVMLFGLGVAFVGFPIFVLRKVVPGMYLSAKRRTRRAGGKTSAYARRRARELREGIATAWDSSRQSAAAGATPGPTSAGPAHAGATASPGRSPSGGAASGGGTARGSGRSQNPRLPPGATRSYRSSRAIGPETYRSEPTRAHGGSRWERSAGGAIRTTRTDDGVYRPVPKGANGRSQPPATNGATDGQPRAETTQPAARTASRETAKRSPGRPVAGADPSRLRDGDAPPDTDSSPQ